MFWPAPWTVHRPRSYWAEPAMSGSPIASLVHPAGSLLAWTGGALTGGGLLTGGGFGAGELDGRAPTRESIPRTSG